MRPIDGRSHRTAHPIRRTPHSDYIASRGYDVYLLDVRGCGKSTRPKEMAEDAKNNPPIVEGMLLYPVVESELALVHLPHLHNSWGRDRT
jgi:pimeloyl-ACP methyl ester carboxylesterase